MAPPQIIGAGFGRTGTMSLKDAIEELGYGKCHHMIEVKPWMFRKWSALADGDDLWNEVYEGFDAAVDWPTTAFYRQLAEKHPDAKVVLTVRDPEAWYDSANNTIFAIFNLLPLWIDMLTGFRTMLDKTIWTGAFHGRFADKEYAIRMFNEHIADVKRTIPADRLLIFRATDGWEPLCTFLDKPIPSKPYPHSNERTFLRGVVRKLQVLRAVSYLTTAGATIYVLKKLGVF
eukprot:TRINITY_DN2107_c0_g2_i3.p1 TRINITY_DN2107_c0_g2~~TRINITY_DN2107_c0_g2_i3.p1  ORF type:complete len:241 (+),score=70.73 TRINITY_DN2107_c0_g2_i3:33-725(+)